MEISRDLSDVSSEDSMSEEEEVQDDGKADRLEVQLKENPFDYNLNVQYIKELRKIGDLTRLRDARHSLIEMYPLTEDVWLDWLEDEENLASSVEEIENLISLYERACSEYLSIPLWLSYAKYLVSLVKRDEQADFMKVEKARQVFERAIAKGGLHVQEGSYIFATYREFEEDMLAVMESAGVSDKELEKQKQRIRQIFQRQLSIPLQNMEESFAEYCSWEAVNQGSVKSIESSFKQALAKLGEITAFESKLDETSPQDAASSDISSWVSYIEYEERYKPMNVLRVISLYERSLKFHFLRFELWQNYIHFLEKNLKNVPNTITETYQRSLRNIAWSGSLWSGYIQHLEQLGEPLEGINRIYEKALSLGLKSSHDYYELFVAYCVFLRRKLDLSNSEEQQQLRNALTEASAYLEQYFPDTHHVMQFNEFFAGLEARIFKNMENARNISEKLLKKRGKDYQRWMFYITLERYCGDTNKCRSLYKRACHSCKDYPEWLWEDWLNFERETGTFEDWRLAKEKIENKFLEVSAARAREDEKKNETSKNQPQKPKRKTTEIQEEPVPKKQKVQLRTELTRVNPEVDHRTAFVVNLPFSANEASLEKKFSPYGTIKEVRLVKDKNGRSKGFAYIEFQNEEEAKASLKLDQTQFGGRTLKVSISMPPAKKNRDHPDNKTIYVSNLDPSVTQEELKSFFEECGEIEDLRIVKDRITSEPKGFAYVDFKEIEGVNKAIELKNNINLKSKQIKVAKSAPPKSRSMNPPETTILKSTMLIPRQLRKPAAPQSNEDFRKKFLGGKQ